MDEGKRQGSSLYGVEQGRDDISDNYAFENQIVQARIPDASQKHVNQVPDEISIIKMKKNSRQIVNIKGESQKHINIISFQRNPQEEAKIKASLVRQQSHELLSQNVNGPNPTTNIVTASQGMDQKLLAYKDNVWESQNIN